MVQGSGVRVQLSGFRVEGSWVRAQGSGFREPSVLEPGTPTIPQGLGFRV